MSRIFDSTIHSVERALNFSATKNKTISQNIANVDTPGYKSKSVTFKDVLSQEKERSFAAKRTDSKHIPFSANNNTFNIQENSNTTYNHNGNNVDIDYEMTQLAENQIYYNSMVDRLNDKMRTLQTVIRGGS